MTSTEENTCRLCFVQIRTCVGKQNTQTGKRASVWTDQRTRLPTDSFSKGYFFTDVFYDAFLQYLLYNFCQFLQFFICMSTNAWNSNSHIILNCQYFLHFSVYTSAFATISLIFFNFSSRLANNKYAVTASVDVCKQF